MAATFLEIREEVLHDLASVATRCKVAAKRVKALGFGDVSDLGDQSALLQIQGRADGISRAGSVSDCVFWDAGLLDAATHGSEALIGATIPIDILQGGPQWWTIHKDDRRVGTRDHSDRGPYCKVWRALECMIWHSYENSEVPSSPTIFDAYLVDEKQASKPPPPGARLEAILTEYVNASSTFHSTDGTAPIKSEHAIRAIFIFRDPHKASFHGWSPHFYHMPLGVPLPTESAPIGTAICAALLFMREQFVTIRRSRAAMGRKFRTQDGWEHRSRYQVVALRRRHVSDPGDAQVTAEGQSPSWDKHWIQRGHWRKLHQPRKKDGAEVTYVRPCYKGNLDGYLVQPRSLVYHVKR